MPMPIAMPMLMPRLRNGLADAPRKKLHKKESMFDQVI